VNVPKWASGQARGVVFVFVVLAVLGGLMLGKMPVLLFPRVSFPRVRISLDAGNRPAERMMTEVTRPVEQTLRGIAGVVDIRSTTSRGSADVDVDFNWGHDMVAAELQVSSALARIASTLPAGTHYDARRMDPTVYPVIAYSLTSKTHSLTELHDLALYQLRPALETVSGVAKVGVQGGAVEEWRVEVDQAKLRSFGMSLDDVAKALSASNVLTAVGRFQQNDKLYLVLSDTRFKDATEIRQTIIRSGNDGVVRLDDVASVRQDTQPQYIRVTADGQQAVLFSIYQQPGGNTVGIAKAIKKKLKAESARIAMLKDGSVHVANWYDQSNMILKSEGSVRDAIMVGVLLAAVVLFLFLRSWKITLIATVAVPMVLATTMLILFMMKMSLNIMTLGGMAAAVGLIIDDAIVIVEHVVRRLRGGGAKGKSDSRGQVVDAVVEFTRPLTGSSFSTIVIFAPLALLSGVTGAFFKALSITMAASLVVSFFMAWLAIPVVSARFLGSKEIETRDEGAAGKKFSSLYRGGAGWLFARPWMVLFLVIPMLALGWVAFGHVKSGFMPAMDEGGFILDYNAPPGTSLIETDRELRQVEAILSTDPAVETYSRRTGLQLGGGITEANQGDFFVRLKSFPRPPIDAVMSRVRQRIAYRVPALQIETSQLMEDLIGDLTGVPQPIDVKLLGPDQQTLLKTAPKVAEAIGRIKGVVEVKSGIVVAGDSLDVEVDRTKAALAGLTPEAVTQTLNDYLSGKVTTRIQQGPQLVGVRVWVPRDIRQTQKDIEELRMQGPNGQVFPLEMIATIKVVTGNPQIDRYNLQRDVAVTGRISGRDLGSTMNDVKKLLQKKGTLPSSVTYLLGGTYQRQQKSFHGLMIVMIAALMLVFSLLLFLYRSFRVALAFLTVIIMEICWIFMALWLTGTELDIMSIMGMTMIVGIVTEVSIFFYSEYSEMGEEDAIQDRLVEAGIRRARAIAMTTIAAILALAMLALGIGQGAALLQPLAIAIVAGLIAQVPLSLAVLPSLVLLYRGFWRRKDAPAEAS
jgi:CzcA family heavy metal efflux pump